MKKIKLDGRLNSVAELVRQGAVFADIGTDHGYLPLYLLENEKISFAYLSDINEGPLESAKRNARECGLYDRCHFLLSDGLCSMPPDTATDIAICGMGGELIIKIIDEARDICKSGVRLILQPMSRAELLREYLYRKGFRIIKESYSYAGGKYYLTILAEFTGSAQQYSEITLHFGEERHLLPLNNATRGYLNTKRTALSRELEGRTLGGLSREGLPTLIEYINKILEN